MESVLAMSACAIVVALSIYSSAISTSIANEWQIDKLSNVRTSMLFDSVFQLVLCSYIIYEVSRNGDSLE